MQAEQQVNGRRRLAPWLSGYRGRDVLHDGMAGLLVAALAIPQSLGYALVAGIPVQIGLYTLPPALLAYAIFGSSRLLFMGPVSTVSVLSGSVVGQLSGGDPAQATRLTAALALIAGVILIVSGLLRMGWVAKFLSEPILTGFVTGLVVLIVVGEVPGLMGLPVPQGNLFERLWILTREFGDFDGLTVLAAAVSLVILFVGSKLVPQLPWALIVLVAGIAISAWTGLSARGVTVVGEVPLGLPVPVWPFAGMADTLSHLGALLTGGAAIAAVGLAEGLAAARTFADDGAKVRDDDEFVGNGAADVAAGLFGGMGVGGSLSKTAANVRAGARSQGAGVAAALVVIVVLLVATGLLIELPKAVLSAIVVHAVWSLLHPSRFLQYKRIRRNDFVAAVVAFVGVLVLGPLFGLLAAIGQSLLGLVYRTLQVTVEEMGKIPGEKGAWGAVVHDASRKRVPGVVILRPAEQVFWANAETVLDAVRAELDAPRDDEPQVVVLDLGSTGQMDITTAARLMELIGQLRADGKDMYLVRIVPDVGTVLERSGVTGALGPGHIWHSIGAAVKAARHDRDLPARLPAGEVDPADHSAVDADLDNADDTDVEKIVHQHGRG